MHLARPMNIRDAGVGHEINRLIKTDIKFQFYIVKNSTHG